MHRFILAIIFLSILAACSPASSPTPAVPDSSASSATSTALYGWDGQLMTGKHHVVLHTTSGDITLELDADAAPKAVTNFITLAQAGFYNDLTFHRVIDGFMIQGGDPNGNGTGGTSIFGDTFEDEHNDYQMVRGVIAMANRGPDTNGSQFFILQGDAAPWLQDKHTIFGRVTAGMDVVDAIAQAPKDSRDMPTSTISYTVDVVE